MVVVGFEGGGSFWTKCTHSTECTIIILAYSSTLSTMSLLFVQVDTIHLPVCEGSSIVSLFVSILCTIGYWPEVKEGLY